MRDKLEQYNLTDPNPETNNLPDSLGVFKGEEWGSYFDGKFDLLTDWGAKTELDALMAGAFIEELDMHDIAVCPQVMVDAEYGETIIVGKGKNREENDERSSNGIEDISIARSSLSEFATT